MSSKDSYWFSHDANASEDPKLIALIAKYDMQGYGRWWRLCELLRSQGGYRYIINTKFAYHSLGTALRLQVDDTRAFINDCIHEFDLLKTDETYIWSDSLLRRMSSWDATREKFSERGRKGAEATNAKKALEKQQQEQNSEYVPESELNLKSIIAEYEKMEKNKRNIYSFIQNKKPHFISPYIDIWNIWATERGKSTVMKSTKLREKHLAARLKEKAFDFLLILSRAAESVFCTDDESGWFSFDWIIESESHYIKVLEGKYKNSPANGKANNTVGISADDELTELINKKNGTQH